MARVDNTGGSGFTVDNGTGLAVRTKLNQIIAALSTLNQGSGTPSIGLAAYTPFIDGNTLKIQNAANNAAISIGDVSLANLGHASLSVVNTFTARATFNVTSSITIPTGTTAQRDGSPAVGMIRHNSQLNRFEGYNNGNWENLGGASGLANLVDDTSPQLGGNLDLQAFELNTSTSNGNIKLNPNGTGVVEIKGDGSSNDGALQLNCYVNSHGVKIKSPTHSAGQSYTIILPDNQIAADKILKVKSITGSGSTAVGQLEFADAAAGGGKLLQVKQTVKTNTASRISTSFGDLVTVTITPASATSKFLVSYKCSMSTANGGYSGSVRLTRDSTAIYIGDASGSRRQCSSSMEADSDGIGDVKVRDMNGEFLDSPNTTSAITYKLQYASDYSNAFVYVGKSQNDANAIYRPRVPTSITVMEIAA